jgi:signal transduction histidine kinase/CHASE1-domain containing sensor protein
MTLFPIKLPAPSSLRSIALAAFFYFCFAIAGLSFAIPPGYASPIFPAAGLAVALMLWSGNRAWPGIFLGSFLSNLTFIWTSGDLSVTRVWVACAIATGSTLQAIVAARLVTWRVGNAWQELQQEFDVIACLVLAGFVACFISASVGVSGLFLAGIITPSAYINSWWNWWVGDVLGVLIAMPLVLSILYRKQPSWRNRFKTIVFPMLVMLLAVAAIVALASRWEQDLRKDEIKKHGEVFQKLIEGRYIAHKEAISALARLVEVTPDMTYTQFEYFTRITLQDNPDIFALSFNPYVLLSQRAEFEQQMSVIGLTSAFQIKERNADGRLVVAGIRDKYAPVGFIAPLTGNESALGFDVNSDPVRRDAIQHAVKSENVALTAPIRLVQERQDRLAVLIFHPAYLNQAQVAKNLVQNSHQSNNIAGFATAVVKLDELISIATGSAMVDGLVYQIDDVTDAQHKQSLFRSDHAAALANTDYLWRARSVFADRTWEIAIYPTTAYLHKQPTPAAWFISVIGLFFTALLQLLMLVVTGRTSLVEVKVREQTFELHQKRDELQDSNAQLNALFALSPDGFVAFSEDGLIQFANPAFEKITGISNAEIWHQHVNVLNLKLKKRAQFPEQFKGIATYFSSDGIASPQNELVLMRPQKSVLQIIGMHSDAANISSILYLRDITAEAEVANLKTEFISHAAHELRTPMPSIYGYIELLMHRNFDEKMRSEILEAMQRQAELVVNMINELLDLARIDARGGKDFNFELISLNDLISGIVADLKLEKTLWNISLNFNAGEIKINGDRSKIRQAIMNVLTNAEKYSSSGKEIKVSILQIAGYAGVEICDHGIGMSEEQVQHVGERFWRADTSGSRPGTGLGMSIVKELVEYHGGYVEISSKLNVGTNVTLWFLIANNSGK